MSPRIPQKSLILGERDNVLRKAMLWAESAMTILADRFVVEKRKKTATLAVRMEPCLKEAAERAAADDHRSLTQFLDKLLTDYLRPRGYLKP
jgi:hypothetical protein